MSAWKAVLLMGQDFLAKGSVVISRSTELQRWLEEEDRSRLEKPHGVVLTGSDKSLHL